MRSVRFSMQKREPVCPQEFFSFPTIKTMKLMIAIYMIGVTNETWQKA